MKAEIESEIVFIRDYGSGSAAVIAIGVFHHKWHKRTEWKLCAIELGLPEFANATECPRKPDGYNAYGELAGMR